MAKAQADIRSLARAHTGSAIKTLVGIMLQPEAQPAARVAAANSILDRGWGKPAQHTEVTGKDGEPLVPAVDDRELARRIALLLAKA